MPMSRGLLVALVFVPALARAEAPANELHRIALSIGVGNNRPATVELAIRPLRHLELGLTGATDESDDEFTSFGASHDELGRSSVNARVIGVIAHDATWRIAAHVGMGLGHDRVTVVEHHFGPNASFDEYAVDDARTGTYLRGDAGVTIASGPVEARVSCGIEGIESVPYIAASIGLSFW
jgi:hypothetical protein